ncbi:MAG: enoyl-CoA hydratase, partial [Aureispira sp.]
MEYTNLLTEYNNGILVVTINRPKALNALNKQTLSDLRQLFEKDALSLADLRGVVLTGAGEKAFVAGADITEFNG